MSLKQQLLVIGIVGIAIDLALLIRDIKKGQTSAFLGLATYQRTEAPGRFWSALLLTNLVYIIVLSAVVLSGLRAPE